MVTPQERCQQGGKAQSLASLDGFDGSLATRTYHTLRRSILNLTYVPGELLRKGEICAALGVSRSPVSEAIARLAAEGLVDVVPKAGTYVARFSMRDIREGSFLREAIELAAIDLVAPRLDDGQIDQLAENLDRQERHIADTDFAGFYAEDAAFHRLILSFTGFPRSAQLAELAWVQVDRARQQVLPMAGRVAATMAEHRDILHALRSRDPVAARGRMQHHLRQLMTVLEPLERDRPDLFAPDD